MRIMSYNTLFGGFDGGDDRRYRSQIEIIRKADPDILLLQEVKGYLDNGGRLLFSTEAALGLRGFVAAAPITGQNTAIFLKSDFEPLSFDIDHDHFHHSAALLRVRVQGLDKPLTAISVHLCPNSPHVRQREVSYLFNHADPDTYVIIGGDFNSVSPEDEEPMGLHDLPALFRMRYAASDGSADRSTIEPLLRAGFEDVAVKLIGQHVPTVPGAAFKGTEFMPFRSDYLLASQTLADRAMHYEVIRNAATDAASDHYPILANFDTT